jgi:hypothetical protein
MRTCFTFGETVGAGFLIWRYCFSREMGSGWFGRPAALDSGCDNNNGVDIDLWTGNVSIGGGDEGIDEGIVKEGRLGDEAAGSG